MPHAPTHVSGIVGQDYPDGPHDDGAVQKPAPDGQEGVVRGGRRPHQRARRRRRRLLRPAKRRRRRRRRRRRSRLALAGHGLHRSLWHKKVSSKKRGTLRAGVGWAPCAVRTHNVVARTDFPSDKKDGERPIVIPTGEGLHTRKLTEKARERGGKRRRER